MYPFIPIYTEDFPMSTGLIGNDKWILFIKSCQGDFVELFFCFFLYFKECLRRFQIRITPYKHEGIWWMRKLPKLMDPVLHFLKSGIQFTGLILPRSVFYGYFTVNATSMVSLKQFSKVCFVFSILIKWGLKKLKSVKANTHVH